MLSLQPDRAVLRLVKVTQSSLRFKMTDDKGVKPCVNLSVLACSFNAVLDRQAHSHSGVHAQIKFQGTCQWSIREGQLTSAALGAKVVAKLCSLATLPGCRLICVDAVPCLLRTDAGAALAGSHCVRVGWSRRVAGAITVCRQVTCS